MSTEQTVLVRLTMGWSGLPRGTELHLAHGKALNLIGRGIAELVGCSVGSHVGVPSYVRK